jgi:hypothetical protein
MQKLFYFGIYLALNLGLAVPCKAQTEMNEEDLLKTGEYIYNRATSNLFVPGKGGENQTWDFSDLKASTTETYNLTGFKADTTLKDANITETINGNISAYYKKTSTGIYSVTGNAIGGFQNLKFMSLPLKYSQKEIDSSINISQFTGISMGIDTLDSVRVITRLTMWSEVDAWGSLKIPNAVFNTLRLKIKIITKQDLEGKKTGQSFKLISEGKWSDTAVYYQWYSPGEGHWVLNNFEKHYVKYKKIEPAQLESFKDLPSAVQIQMNSNQTISLVNNGTSNYKIFLTDMAGRRIADEALHPNQTLTTDISMYARGMYVLYLVNEEMGDVYFRKLVF